MTEYIVVYKPRGRPVNYPYNVYRQVSPPTSVSFNLYVHNAEFIGASVALHSGGITFAAQQFQAPPAQPYVTGIQFGAARLYLTRTGSPTGPVTVTLRADSGDNRPGAILTTIASFDASAFPAGYNTWTIPPGTNLTFGAKYWLVVHFNGGNSSNTVNVHRTSATLTGLFSATSTNGITWTTSSTLWFSIGVRYRYLYSYTADFPYATVYQHQKRLEEIASPNLTIEAVRVNSQSVTPPLTKEKTIPQATSYTIEGIALHNTLPSGTTTGSLTAIPYIYFMDPIFETEKLGASEAYLLRVAFESNSVLRINDLPDSDLYGRANTVIDFADLAIPVRRLEWIYGSGECTLLVID